MPTITGRARSLPLTRMLPLDHPQVPPRQDDLFPGRDAEMKPRRGSESNLDDNVAPLDGGRNGVEGLSVRECTVKTRIRTEFLRFPIRGNVGRLISISASGRRRLPACDVRMRPSLRFMVFDPPSWRPILPPAGSALAPVNVAASNQSSELAHHTVVGGLDPPETDGPAASERSCIDPRSLLILVGVPTARSKAMVTIFRQKSESAAIPDQSKPLR